MKLELNKVSIELIINALAHEKQAAVTRYFYTLNEDTQTMIEKTAKLYENILNEIDRQVNEQSYYVPGDIDKNIKFAGRD